MLLLVGLGNPGPDYQGNRHNIGFMAVDEIVHRHSFGPYRARFRGLAAQGEVAGTAVLALKPLIFVNRSGESVAAAARFHKIPLDRIVVIHDELDLVPGKIRVKRGGGPAGHNGLRSIDSHIGPDYWRVRLGIGHPGDRARVESHVLRDFPKADRAWLRRLLDAVAEFFPLLAKGNASDFMSKVSHATRPEANLKSPRRPGPPDASMPGADDGV